MLGLGKGGRGMFDPGGWAGLDCVLAQMGGGRGLVSEVDRSLSCPSTSYHR